MKRILCVLMVALMLMGTALAEEEFTLHNGTKFGMTAEETIQLEAEAGVPVASYVILDYSLRPESYGFFITEETTIAGITGVTIYYSFAKDSLFEMKYSFPYLTKETSLQDYTNIENGLTAKYGKTDFSNETGVQFPVLPTDVVFPDIGPDDLGPELPLVLHSNATKTNYSYRLFSLDDGTFVLIQHELGCYIEKPDFTYHNLVYLHLSVEEAQHFFDAMESANDDL